jgi:polyisoprenoid-binding protein YceI
VPGSKAATLLAKLVHGLLYVVMIGGPLTGWVLVSTAKIKFQTMLFGLVPWPHLPLGAGWNEPAHGLHGLIGLLLAASFVLHVAGALRHHFMQSDVIGRMLPAAVVSRGGLTIAAGLALLGAVGAFAAARVWPFPAGSTGSEVGEAGSVPAPASAAPEPAASETPSPTESAAPSEAASAAASEAATEAASAAPNPATAWQVEPGGQLGFRTSYSGSAVVGSFKRWDADIVFSPDDLAHSRIRVSVDLASVDSAEGERDDMLRSASFFDVAAHPRAVFTATAIRAQGPGRYRANGTLQLHGQSRPVPVSFDLKIKGDHAAASGTAQLNRTAFGVGSGEWAGTGDVPDGVSVTFRFGARRR